jgi:hypothetical protein
MMAISTIAMICLQIWHSLVVETKRRKLWESIANNTESNVQEDKMGNTQPNMADNKSNHDSKTNRERFENWITQRRETAEKNLTDRQQAEGSTIFNNAEERLGKIDRDIEELEAAKRSLQAEKWDVAEQRKKLYQECLDRHEMQLEKINKPGLIERFGTLVFDSIDAVKTAVRKKALEVLGVESEISELKERIAQLELVVDPTKVPVPQIEPTQVEVEEEQETEPIQPTVENGMWEMIVQTGKGLRLKSDAAADRLQEKREEILETLKNVDGFVCAEDYLERLRSMVREDKDLSDVIGNVDRYNAKTIHSKIRKAVGV